MTHVETTTVTTTDTPLITINQITLSGKQLWAIAATIFGLLSTGFAGGYLFVPARASAVNDLAAIVATIQQQHAETRQHLASLTTETLKLTTAVDGLQKAVKVQTATARKRVVTPPRPVQAGVAQ